uniref:S1-like domain-containing protein n=1 Tax=viral metagenome TaxID=1070528 RepID=A0A6C0KZK3_9ZZZZ|tara:strand:+ start:4782 stop:5228 length:447 start_codon:yes stop_codon:yes gene_type:complete
MPRGNKTGGKKHKRNKNQNYETKALRTAEDGQTYAKIANCKGNCRFDVNCCDGKDRMAIMCGSMRKRKFVNAGDIVLVSLRDFQDSVCDIIDSYDENQAKKLKDMKEIPETMRLEEDNQFDEIDDEGVIFTNEMPESDSEDSIDIDDI